MVALIEHKSMEGGKHQWRDELGVTFTLSKVEWTFGKCFAIVTVTAPDNDKHLGASRIELSSEREVRLYAKSIQDRNGHLPANYEESLRSIWLALEEQRAKGVTIQATALSDVPKEEIDWLWRGRIARGKLSILAGDPDVGKSFVTLDLAARVSLGGILPDGGRAPEGVCIFLTAEDGWGDTVRRRFDAIGGKAKNVLLVPLTVKTMDGMASLNLAQHLDAIERLVKDTGAILLVIDPILAFMGPRANANQTTDVRAVLAPLVDMAARTSVAIVGVMHLNKRSGDGNALYRVTSSLDFVAAARTAFLLARDPTDPKARVLAQIKNNLYAEVPALRFRFTEDGAISWEEDTVAVTASSLLTPTVETKALAAAKAFLREQLADGPAESAQIEAAADDAGISARTLDRARKALVDAYQVSNVWYMKLKNAKQAAP